MTFFVDILEDCVGKCNCARNDYNPICLDEIGLNFHSACAAGCKEFTIDNVGTNEEASVSYGDCTCLRQHFNGTFATGGLTSYGHPAAAATLINQNRVAQKMSAVKGECLSNDENCYVSFYIFTGVLAFMAFFISSGRVGTMLLQLRAIDVKDKVCTKHVFTGCFFSYWIF